MSKRFIFNKLSIILFIIGIIIITAGYIIMSTGDTTISPILLIFAYLVIYPLSILIGLLKRGKKDHEG